MPDSLVECIPNFSEARRPEVDCLYHRCIKFSFAVSVFWINIQI